MPSDNEHMRPLWVATLRATSAITVLADLDSTCLLESRHHSRGGVNHCDRTPDRLHGKFDKVQARGMSFKCPKEE